MTAGHAGEQPAPAGEAGGDLGLRPGEAGGWAAGGSATEARQVLEHAVAEAEALLGVTRWSRIARRWLLGAPDVTDREADRRELAGYLAPWSRRRRRLRAMTATALACTRLQLAIAEAPRIAYWQVHLLERRLVRRRLPTRWSAVTWQVEYNAACFYARALAIPDVPADVLGRAAMAHLDRALRDSGSGLSLAWVQTDPDLEALRRHPAFRSWWTTLLPALPRPAAPGAAVEVLDTRRTAQPEADERATSSRRP